MKKRVFSEQYFFSRFISNFELVASVTIKKAEVEKKNVENKAEALTEET